MFHLRQRHVAALKLIRRTFVNVGLHDRPWVVNVESDKSKRQTISEVREWGRIARYKIIMGVFRDGTYWPP